VPVLDFLRRRLLGRRSAQGPAPGPRRSRYPGDFRGIPHIEYRPTPDGLPDPGEIVWAWVPFEENNGQGKDRPILVIGRDAEWLLGVMLTSKDHNRDAAREAHFGRYWMDIGPGPWDRERRPSEVRLDRIIRLRPTEVRREGAALDRRLFDEVGRAVISHRGR
jgi:hypothetical protein